MIVSPIFKIVGGHTEYDKGSVDHLWNGCSSGVWLVRFRWWRVLHCENPFCKGIRVEDQWCPDLDGNKQGSAGFKDAFFSFDGTERWHNRQCDHNTD